MDPVSEIDGLVLGNNIELFHDQLFDIFTCSVETDKCISADLKHAHQEHDFSWYFSSFEIYIDPDLPYVMAHESPPSFDFFLSLPSVLDIPRSILKKYDFVYGLTMEKPGHKPRLSIGSAASQAHGAAPRVKHYQDDDTFRMSRYTQKSLDEGYEITHIGILAAIKKPPPEEVELRSYGRALTLTFEASDTWLFWSVYRGLRNEDGKHYMSHACPWNREELEWTGLNSHSPMAEPVHSMALTAEELRARIERVRQKWKRKYYRQKAKREADPVLMANFKARQKVKNAAFRRRPVFRRWNDQYKAKQKENRVLFKAVQWGEVEETADIQKKLASVEKLHQKAKNYREKNPAFFEQVNKDARASREAYKKVKEGLLDKNDPVVAQQIAYAVNHESSTKKSLEKAKANGTDMKSSFAALLKVDRGELDGNDPKVKKLIAKAARKRATSKARNARLKAARDAKKPKKSAVTMREPTLAELAGNTAVSSLKVLRLVRKGELDGNNPAVKAKMQLALEKENVKKDRQMADRARIKQVKEGQTRLGESKDEMTSNADIDIEDVDFEYSEDDIDSDDEGVGMDMENASLDDYDAATDEDTAGINFLSQNNVLMDQGDAVSRSRRRARHQSKVIPFEVIEISDSEDETDQARDPAIDQAQFDVIEIQETDDEATESLPSIDEVLKLSSSRK